MSENSKKLYRLPKQGKILGVCAGLAKYFDMDVVLVRVVFVILIFATGGGAILLYIILAILMPTSSESGDESMDARFHKLGEDLKSNKALYKMRNYFGVGLIALGSWLLLVRLFPEIFNLRWDYVWPTLLIIFGMLMILRRNKNG